MLKHFNSIQLNDSSKAKSNAPISFIYGSATLIGLFVCEQFLLLYADKSI